MRMFLKVTKDHIEKTNRNCYNASTCPLANALRARGCKDVKVMYSNIFFTLDGSKYEVPHTKHTQEFINNFDGRFEVEPRIFRLDF